MIRRIYASDKRFKSVTFEAGLNIIIAERTKNSGNKDTRNGAGKTTLINVIHFCFGADLHKLDLPVEEIRDWTFFIELELFGKRITAKRSIDKPSIISITSEASDFVIAPVKDEEKGEWLYKNDEWKKLLGICLFGLREQVNAKYSPSFRGLFSYFVRKGVDAYSKPFLHFRNQKTYDWQINNAYFLGLNWVLASEAQEIRDQEQAMKALNSALKANLVATQGELEAERVRLEKKLVEESKALETFKVHSQYKELQEKANQLTEDIHQLSNQNLILRTKLSRYEDAIASEKAPPQRSVEKLYAEANVYFSDNLKKTLDEAKQFHASVVKNRQKFLEVEVVEIKNQIAEKEALLKSNTEERASILKLLKTHGALEEFYFLQEKILHEKEILEKTKMKLADIKELSAKKKAIKARKLELETKIQRDYEERRPNWEKAVALFNENSLALYDKPGDLIINTTENGYEFDVVIKKSTSEGVSKMKIFCYDLMLVELFAQNGGIDFLFHDSTIYDGVDSRQRAHALAQASKKAQEGSFQYICALNSDMIPYDEFEEDFDITENIRLRLGDQKPSDSLFGFHFELKKKRESTPE